MSVRVMSWVWEHSRAEGTDRLVLLAIADSATDDGGNAWPSTATLAKKAGVDPRTVQRAVRRLIADGELTMRPNAGKNGVNVYRVTMTPRQSATPAQSHPGAKSPRQPAAPAESRSTPGTESPTPRQSATQTVLEPSTNHPKDISSELRPDVERLCDHLADRVEANGSKRPAVGKRWRDAARLMLDTDGRTEQQVHNAIDWCQSDEFWRSNVLSMPKLREKYDQLRLAAARATRASPRTSTADSRAQDALALAARLRDQETP
jgi:hypothetical protein